MSMLEKIFKDTSLYFNEKLDRYGANHKGVDWNSEVSQETRINQVLKIIKIGNSFSINDIGCGYGQALYILKKKYENFSYTGYDVSLKMINEAKIMVGEETDVVFLQMHQYRDVKVADYSIASGIFNLKLEINEEEWINYVEKTLDAMNNNSCKGFSFNMLSKYADDNKKRLDLFYADPCYFFDLCKKKYSNNIILNHNYGLYDFTLYVSK